MFLLILESIGTSELLLIGLVALIIFGPRKLPELARMLGKAKSEFRRTTHEFRETWEREVNFENIDKESESEPRVFNQRNGIQREEVALKNEIVASPEIKEISHTELKENYSEVKVTVPDKTNEPLNDKRDWL